MERATPFEAAGDALVPPAPRWMSMQRTASDGTSSVLVRVLFEDEELLAVDKPAGLVTHPAYKHPDGTLCDAVFARQAARGERRPWLLHRLDRETSGVVLFAKTERARRAVVRQFERRTVGKRYLALVDGMPDPPDGLIEAPLARDPSDRRRVITDRAGKPAATYYRVIATNAGHALVGAEPRTGRTHQIRAHLALLRAPIVGDRQYLPEHGAGIVQASRTMLHAWQLALRYPTTGEPFTVTAAPPPDFLAMARRLGLEASIDSHTEESP